MQSVRRELYDVGSTGEIVIVQIGDVHSGTSACDERRLRRVVQEIAETPHMYWMGMGDYLEAINKTDKRFNSVEMASWVSARDLDDLPRVQADWFLSTMEPIRDKCWVFLDGNHEAKNRQSYAFDVYRYMADAMGQEPVGRTGWLTTTFYFYGPERGREKVKTFEWALHHGMSDNRAAKWRKDHVADFVVMGHTHQTEAALKGARLHKRGQMIDGTAVKFIRSGTFRRHYAQHGTTYSEDMGYEPVAVGHTEVALRPFAPYKQVRLSVIP